MQLDRAAVTAILHAAKPWALSAMSSKEGVYAKCMVMW